MNAAKTMVKATLTGYMFPLTKDAFSGLMTRYSPRKGTIRGLLLPPDNCEIRSEYSPAQQITCFADRDG